MPPLSVGDVTPPKADSSVTAPARVHLEEPSSSEEDAVLPVNREELAAGPGSR